jgi:hypothetical protein
MNVSLARVYLRQIDPLVSAKRQNKITRQANAKPTNEITNQMLLAQAAPTFSCSL